MTPYSIEINSLSKFYKIGKPPRTLKASLEKWYQKIKGGQIQKSAAVKDKNHLQAGPFPDTFWAIKDISLNIKQGEVVGIVGRNGAGKTTLLKILSRITQPTEGKASVRGRVASLLEVGTGFHPDLSGRENVFLNGAIVGMKKLEIKKKFDEIVEFSGIAPFIDTPVKHYSSGMYVRLAFAVAAHLDPDILIVDEVLAVGDSAFQEKCLGKINGAAQSGKTVLFVSHNLHAISNLSKRVLIFERGNLFFDGDPVEAVHQYRNLMREDLGEAAYFHDPAKTTGVIRARVMTSSGKKLHQFGKQLIFEFETVFPEVSRGLSFSFQIVDEQQRCITHMWFENIDESKVVNGRLRIRCVIPTPRLYLGRYTVTTHMANRASLEMFETAGGLCPFEVVMDGIPREYEWRPGACTYIEEGSWEIS